MTIEFDDLEDITYILLQNHFGKLIKKIQKSQNEIIIDFYDGSHRIISFR